MKKKLLVKMLVAALIMSACSSASSNRVESNETEAEFPVTAMI